MIPNAASGCSAFSRSCRNGARPTSGPWEPTAPPPGGGGLFPPGSIFDANGDLILAEALCSVDVSHPFGGAGSSVGGLFYSTFKDGCSSVFVKTDGGFDATGDWWGSADGPEGVAVLDRAKHTPSADAPWIWGFRANPDPADLGSHPRGSAVTIGLAPAVLVATSGPTVIDAVYLPDLRADLADAVTSFDHGEATRVALVDPYLRLGYRVTGANPASDPVTGWIPIGSDDSLTLTGTHAGTDKGPPPATRTGPSGRIAS